MPIVKTKLDITLTDIYEWIRDSLYINMKQDDMHVHLATQILANILETTRDDNATQKASKYAAQEEERRWDTGRQWSKWV